MKTNRSRNPLLILLLTLSLILAACEDVEVDLAVDLALDWAHEKGLVICQDPTEDPANCEPEFTPTFYRWAAGEGAEQVTADIPLLSEFGELAGEMLKPDLDEGAEDVLDTAVTAKDIIEADALAEEGFEEGDPDKIRQAIEMRENDWSYDEKLAVVLLLQGDQSAASDAQNQAEEKTRQHLDATLENEGLTQADEDAYRACVATYGNLYSQRENALFIQINKLMDADPPQEADTLIRQLDLVRKQMTDLEQNAPGNPCFNFGPSQ